MIEQIELQLFSNQKRNEYLLYDHHKLQTNKCKTTSTFRIELGQIPINTKTSHKNTQLNK